MTAATGDRLHRNVNIHKRLSQRFSNLLRCYKQVYKILNVMCIIYDKSILIQLKNFIMRKAYRMLKITSFPKGFRVGLHHQVFATNSILGVELLIGSRFGKYLTSRVSPTLKINK